MSKALKLLTQSMNKRIAHYDDGSFTSVPLANPLKQIHDPKKLVKAFYKSFNKHGIYHQIYNQAFNELHHHGNPIIDFHDQFSEQAFGIGDSYKLIPFLPTGIFTLVATDPKYIMTDLYKHHKDKAKREQKFYHGSTIANMKHGFHIHILDQFVRLCYGNTINILLCCSQEMIHSINTYFSKNYNCSLKNKRITLINWGKDNAYPNSTSGFRLTNEYIMHIHKNVKFESLKRDYHLTGESYLSSNNGPEDRIFRHQSVKPLFLIKNLIQTASHIKLPRGVHPAVLDPFCGTGTTAVACKMLHLSGIFLDFNASCIHTAIKRMFAPIYLDRTFIKYEDQRVKRMESEYDRLNKGNLESRRNIKSKYKAQHRQNVRVIKQINSNHPFKKINALLTDFDTLNNGLSYLNSYQNNSSALHIRSTRTKHTRTNLRVAK